MQDPKEFPIVVETAEKSPGAKVTVLQLTRQQAVELITRVQGACDVWVHEIKEVSVEDFMRAQDQKNYCWDCKEFLMDYDHAKRCEDLNHTLIWRKS